MAENAQTRSPAHEVSEINSRCQGWTGSFNSLDHSFTATRSNISVHGESADEVVGITAMIPPAIFDFLEAGDGFGL